MTTMRVLPAGDSITVGVANGYRARLARALANASMPVTWVGTQGRAPLVHEGHTGWSIGQIAAALPAWMQQHQPDIVLLMIGTNDAPGDQPMAMAATLRALAILIVDGWRTPLVLATIPPLRGHQATVDAYNAAIRALVAEMRAGGRRVALADAAARMGAGDVGPDGIHPNDDGYAQIAAAMFDGLRVLAGDAPASAHGTRAAGSSALAIVAVGTLILIATRGT